MMRLILRLAEAEQLPVQRGGQMGIQGVGHGLGAAEPHRGVLAFTQGGEIQSAALGLQMQPVVDPDPAAQLGQPVGAHCSKVVPGRVSPRRTSASSQATKGVMQIPAPTQSAGAGSGRAKAP